MALRVEEDLWRTVFRRISLTIALLETLTLFAVPSWGGQMGDWLPTCRRADLIVVGTLHNLKKDAQFRSRKAHDAVITSYFDTGEVEVETILKGLTTERRLRVYWFHRVIAEPQDKVTIFGGGPGPQLDNGARGIWVILDVSKTSWDCYKAVFCPMTDLERIKAILADPTGDAHR